MDSSDYIIERLRASGEVDLDTALNSFSSQKEFVSHLISFADSPKKNLMGFDAYKIARRNESRKEFLMELKILREQLTMLGLTNAAAGINHLEYASFNKDGAFLERELSDFRLKMDRLSALVEAVRKPPAKQAVQPIQASQAVQAAQAAQIAQAAKDMQETQVPQASDDPDEEERHLILAVDDMKVLLSSVVAMLLDKYIVMAVTSGKAALKVLEKHRPSLFLLDIEMPGMNGYELAAAIREDNRFKDTPIIFLTAHATRDAVVTAIKHGGNDYIIKPVEKEKLIEKIQRLLK